VTGLVIGDFSDGGEGINDTIQERFELLGVPMVEGAAVGHEALNLAVPLGLPVRLDATAGTLTPSGLAGS
jgi:muramoyltetrapeptide carboxypeptidase